MNILHSKCSKMYLVLQNAIIIFSIFCKYHLNFLKFHAIQVREEFLKKLIRGKVAAAMITQVILIWFQYFILSLICILLSILNLLVMRHLVTAWFASQQFSLLSWWQLPFVCNQWCLIMHKETDLPYTYLILWLNGNFCQSSRRAVWSYSCV